MTDTSQYADYLNLPITRFYRTLRHIDSKNLVVAAVGLEPIDRARFLVKLKPCVSTQVYGMLEENITGISPDKFNEVEKVAARTNISEAIALVANEHTTHTGFDLIVRRASLFNFSGMQRCRKCRRMVELPNELIPLRNEARAGLICTKCAYNMPGILHPIEDTTGNGHG